MWLDFIFSLNEAVRNGLSTTSVPNPNPKFVQFYILIKSAATDLS